MPFVLGYIDPAGRSQEAAEFRALGSRIRSSAAPQEPLAEAREILAFGSSGAVTTAVGDLTIVAEGDFYWTGRADRHGSLRALAEAFLKHSDDALRHLHGSFAIVIYDHANRATTLAVDRLGIRPLAYSRLPDGTVLFGSSASDIVSHPRVDGRISLQALFHYLYFHVVPSPSTIFEAIDKIEPATAVRIDNREIRLRRYWVPKFRSSPSTKTEDLSQRLHKALGNAVDRCSRDTATGAFLSGGVDSSTVAGLLQQHRNDAVPAYSIGFDSEGYDEMEYAKSAASHFGLDLKSYYVTASDVATAIPIIARAYDEPFGNSSAVAVYFCAKLAHEDGITHLLAGDGGDELFAGNERYAKQKIFDLYQRLPRALRAHVLDRLATVDALETIPVLRKIQSYIRQANVPMPARLETYNVLDRLGISYVLTEDFLSAVDSEGPKLHLASIYDIPESDDILHRMLFLDWQITLADNDLRKVNRMCDENFVSPLYPILDDAVLDLSLEVPTSEQIRKNNLRAFFKNSYREFLPSSTLTKGKHGFGLPFGPWLTTSTHLQDIVYPLLDALKTRNIVNPAFLDKLIAEARDTHASYYGNAIWPFLMLEQWLQTREADVNI